MTQPDNEARIRTALDLATRYGDTDEGHHKSWVIDQMVRALTCDDYEEWVAMHCNSGNYDWDVGIAP